MAIFSSIFSFHILFLLLAILLVPDDDADTRCQQAPRTRMDRAVFELSEKLRHPSDIATKLETMKSTFGEAAELHGRNLSTKLADAYYHVQNVTDGISQLSSDIERFKQQKATNIEALSDFNKLVRDSKTTNLVCRAYQNFLRTKWFISQLESVEESPVDDDILVYHRRIFDKEEFVCELELYNTGLARDDFSRITRAVSEVKRQSVEFTALLVETVDDFVENAEAFESINRIVRAEEERDELTRLAQEGARGKDLVMQQYARSYPQYVTRACKDLRSRITQVIQSAIRAKFSSDPSDERAFPARLGFVLSDIEKLHGSACLDFFSFDDFVTDYHLQLKRYIDRSIDSLDAGEILALIEFKTFYYNKMESSYSKVSEALGPRLVENETVLLEKYAATAKAKLQQWIENITKSEVERMENRDMGIDRDENNKLISSGFIRLLQIIKEQLDPIVFNKQIFLSITAAVTASCKDFQTKILRVMDRECDLYKRGKGRPGFEDYCIMFGNSGLKLAQYVTTLPQCQSLEVRDLGNLFMEILKSSNTILVDFILATCEPVVTKLYKEEWYAGETIQTLAVTLEDFLQDYSAAMSDFSFNAFIYELSRAIAATYVRRLGSKKIYISEEAPRLLRRDYDALMDVLSEYAPKEDVEDCIGLLRRLIPLVETGSPEVFAIEIESIRLQHPEFSKEILKNIVGRRRDIGPDIKERLLAVIRSVRAFK